jgi:hypothetical protein
VLNQLQHVKCVVFAMQMEESLKLYSAYVRDEITFNPETTLFYRKRIRPPRFIRNIVDHRLASAKCQDPPMQVEDLFTEDQFNRMMRYSVYNPARLLEGIAWVIRRMHRGTDSPSTKIDDAIIDAWIDHNGLRAAYSYLKKTIDQIEKVHASDYPSTGADEVDDLHYPPLHESRVEILKKISTGTDTPTMLAQELEKEKSISSISMQLRVLRELHLIGFRAMNRNRIYTLTTGGQALVDFLMEKAHCQVCNNADCEENCENTLVIEKEMVSSEPFAPCEPDPRSAARHGAFGLFNPFGADLDELRFDRMRRDRDLGARKRKGTRNSRGE